MKDTHESSEDYLLTILMLSNSTDGPVHAVDIARELNVSKASVSKALSKQEAEGRVEVVGRDVRLLPEGLEIAARTLRKHNFFMRMLEAAGVDSVTAAAEAHRMEHCISEDSFNKLVALYDDKIAPVPEDLLGGSPAEGASQSEEGQASA